MKSVIDQKHNERDLNLFKSMFGRSAVTTSAYDSKILSIIKTFENQVQDIERENRQLKRSLEEFEHNEEHFRRAKQDLDKDRETMHDRFSGELHNKVEQLSEQNDKLHWEKEQQASSLAALEQEYQRLRHENTELRGLYQELKRGQNPSRDGATSVSTTPSRSGGHIDRSTTPLNKQSNQGEEDRRSGNFTGQGQQGPSQEHLYSFRPFCELSELTVIECRKILSQVEHRTSDSSLNSI